MIEITKEEASKIKDLKARISSLKEVINQDEERKEQQEKTISFKRRQVNQDIADEIHIQVENHYENIKKEFHHKLIKLILFIIGASFSCAYLASGLMAILKSITVASTFKAFLESFLTIFILGNIPRTYYIFKDYKKGQNDHYTVIYPHRIEKALNDIAEEEQMLKSLKQGIAKKEELLVFLESEKRKITNLLVQHLEEFQKDFALKVNPKKDLEKTLTIKKKYPSNKKYLENVLEYEQTSMFSEEKNIPGQISLFDEIVRVREK